MHSFTATGPPLYANNDGANPNGSLILSGNTLYGTCAGGGSSGWGTVFKVNIDGTGFKTLHNFICSCSSCGDSCTNSDGLNPRAGLALAGNTLYGTAFYGGNSSLGTVFSLQTDGTGFTTLYGFTGGSDGGHPWANLVVSSNALFGTTWQGGTSNGSTGRGTIFTISLPVTPPELTITTATGSVILTWPTSATGFTLQSTTNLGSSAIWSTNLPSPVIVNGQNTVTNSISGTEQFYRLLQ